MLRRAGILLVAAALGAGASIGVGACGEDRGSVSVEDGTTGTETTGTGGSGTSTTPTESAPTNPTETGG